MLLMKPSLWLLILLLMKMLSIGLIIVVCFLSLFRELRVVAGLLAKCCNSSIRRRFRAYRRRTNTYALKVEGLQRASDVLHLVHNWVRPHSSPRKGITPAMAKRVISQTNPNGRIIELAPSPRFHHGIADQCRIPSVRCVRERVSI